MSSGFSSSARQQTKASRPFGLRLRRMLMNAAVGSAKNITPNREKAASNEAGSNGSTWASAWTNRTRSHPLAARRANASTAADRSTPTTVPSGATAPGNVQRGGDGRHVEIDRSALGKFADERFPLAR